MIFKWCVKCRPFNGRKGCPECEVIYFHEYNHPVKYVSHHVAMFLFDLKRLAIVDNYSPPGKIINKLFDLHKHYDDSFSNLNIYAQAAGTRPSIASLKGMIVII